MVSVLIAAHNEEARILQCLHSLENLTYSKEELEIWIGDDNSTDATASVITELPENYANHGSGTGQGQCTVQGITL